MTSLGRPTKLTQEIKETVINAIAIGAYDWVAVQAAGIAPSTFYDWMKKGRAGEEGFSEFSEKVDQARASARINAEVAVFKSDPKFWLRCGPGRERPGEPGWTNTANGATSAPLGPPETPMNASEFLSFIRTAMDAGVVGLELDELTSEELFLIIEAGEDTDS